MDIKELSFSYDHKTTFISIEQLTIPKGKVTTIIGPNGSGKSTLLGLLGGSLIADQGQIMLDGKDLQRQKPKERAKQIAVVHQQNEVPHHYTVRQLVEMGRYPYRKAFSGLTKTDDAAIDAALEYTALVNEQHQPVHMLSGGQRQRAWIALALAQQSEYLLLDEPTTYLDAHHQLEILNCVAELNKDQQRTIVMVLHDLNQALQYSDEVIVMQQGEILAQGKVEEVMTISFIQEVFKLQVESIHDSHGEKHFIHLKKQ